MNNINVKQVTQLINVDHGSGTVSVVDAGPPGPPGPSGEVSLAMLEDELALKADITYVDDATALIPTIVSDIADIEEILEDKADTGLLKLRQFEWRGSSPPASYTELNSAPIGSIYTDRLATAGAMVWVKVGVGGSGWRVMRGDTDWRNVTALVNAGSFHPDNVGTLRVRRINENIHWMFDNIILAAGAGSLTIWNTIPIEWRSHPMCQGRVARNNSAIYQDTLQCHGATLFWVGETLLSNGATTNTRPSTPLMGSFIVPAASNLWPTSLIGAAV